MRKETPDHDPYADLITSNQESIVDVLREGIRRAKNAIDAGKPDLARKVLDHASKFHPMYDFPAWPDDAVK